MEQRLHVSESLATPDPCARTIILPRGAKSCFDFGMHFTLTEVQNTKVTLPR
jgi:hypothetical protein